MESAAVSVASAASADTIYPSRQGKDALPISSGDIFGQFGGLTVTKQDVVYIATGIPLGTAASLTVILSTGTPLGIFAAVATGGSIGVGMGRLAEYLYVKCRSVDTIDESAPLLPKRPEPEAQEKGHDPVFYANIV